MGGGGGRRPLLKQNISIHHGDGTVLRNPYHQTEKIDEDAYRSHLFHIDSWFPADLPCISSKVAVNTMVEIV